jgi:hypothetical protein
MTKCLEILPASPGSSYPREFDYSGLLAAGDRLTEIVSVEQLEVSPEDAPAAQVAEIAYAQNFKGVVAKITVPADAAPGTIYTFRAIVKTLMGGEEPLEGVLQVI